MSYHTRLDYAEGTLKNQTRAERRRIEKQQKKEAQRKNTIIATEQNKVFTFTEQQLKEFLAIERQRAIMQVHNEWGDVAGKVFIAAMRIVLHDKYGFGEKRLKDVCDHMEHQLDCIIDKCVTVEEMEEAARNLNDKAKYKG